MITVGMLGCPSAPDVEWNEEALKKLSALGINTLQVNIAWGTRPADEPLNLEDLVPEDVSDLSQVVELRSRPEHRKSRRDTIAKRIKVAKAMGFRTLFHFGAPYNGSDGYLDKTLVNCILDEQIPALYEALLEQFAADFSGVDDLLLYTYDQDAWLCNEFGQCPRCRGIPLHERVVGFVNRLARKWASLNPAGRLWWEPWELSAGQILLSMPSLDPQTVGLMAHSNIAEVMAALPVDRWLKNVSNLARQYNIPLVVETWLGAASEELEPFTHLAHPAVTFRAMQTISQLPHLSGIKDYFGLLPQKDDPNLAISGIFFNTAGISEEQALQQLAEQYPARIRGDLLEYWALCSEAMELFPWDTSWYIREVGKAKISHAMSAAFIRGQQCKTPSWESTRRSIFMKTDNAQPHPWMLEDVQLRCQIAADRMQQALQTAGRFEHAYPDEHKESFKRQLFELNEFRRRALAYAYHLRETNLAWMMRECRDEGTAIPKRIIDEMEATLLSDQDNQQNEEPIGSALKLFRRDIDEFLNTYFLEKEDGYPIGDMSLAEQIFSVTSRI